MPCVGWDNDKLAGIQYLRNIINCHLKPAFDSEGTLFMNMAVPLYRTTCFYLNKIDGIGGCVDQFGEKAGGYLFSVDIGKLPENCFVHKVKLKVKSILKVYGVK